MKKANEVFNWNKEQLEAYAAAFRETDAIYVKGYGWDEVAQVYDDEGGYNCVPYSFGTTNVDKHINSWQMRVGRKWIGYPEDFEENYEIITPKDYEAQAGDKLVWLGKTQKQGSRSELTFGKSYKVEQQGELVYKTDMNIATLARSEKDRWKFWGVIPKWKNVKKEVETTKFKVGDKVSLKRESIKEDKNLIVVSQCVGIVEMVDYSQNKYWYYVEFIDDYTSHAMWIKEEWLELVFSEDNENNEETIDFKVGDIVVTQYTVTDENGKTETIKMGGIINKVDASANSYIVVLNNKLIVWVGIEDIELVFSKDNQDFVETVINEDSKSNFKDNSSEHKALKLLLEIENDNIHELLYRELNKEVMNTMDNLVEGYEFDKVKTIVDTMKELVFD